jgi:MFS family permease
VRTLAPLRHRNFRLYFAGEAISSLGNGIGLIALTWYLLDRTGDATAVSLFWGLALGAGLVTLPLGGVVADRYSRRSIAVAADAIGLATMLLLGAIALAGDPPLALVYAVTFSPASATRSSGRRSWRSCRRSSRWTSSPRRAGSARSRSRSAT